LAWGWRLAFAFGLLIVPVGLYIRRELEDAPVFKKALSAELAIEQKTHKTEVPIWVVLRDHWGSVLTGMLVVMLWTSSTYITNYFPTFAQVHLKVSLSSSYISPVVVGTILMFCPLIGALADRYQRRRVMAVGALGLLVIAYPAFSFLIASPSPQHLVMTQIVFAFFMLIYTAPASTVLAELFPTEIRATGISISYSLGVATFGGFTPMILTALINETGAPVSVAYYLMGTSVISLITVLCLKDRSKDDLT
jgi:MHS family proline/betaine transporter-like MFS transporter